MRLDEPSVLNQAVPRLPGPGALGGASGAGPNFPDPALDEWASAYHAGNYPRLAAVKSVYDPRRFFDFPQAI
jgi:hypothetical protein